MSNELLPCPFCGGEADQVLTDYEQVQVEEVRCRDCWATVGGATEAAAILAWNHRAPVPAAPSHDRMADVRLGAFTALCEERHVVRSAYVYQKEYEVDELEVRRDAARIAATVTLPDAKGEGLPGSHAGCTYLYDKNGFCNKCGTFAPAPETAKGEHICGTSHPNAPAKACDGYHHPQDPCPDCSKEKHNAD